MVAGVTDDLRIPRRVRMTRVSFERRLATGVAFEDKIVAALIDRGWRAELFGQGQLTDEMRDAICRVNTPVRWMPDVITAKRFPARTRLVFIDAKAGETWRKTGRHDVEDGALIGAESWSTYADCETYFVFSSGDTITPAAFRQAATPGTYRGVGSGTPFLLAPRAACQRFDTVFGAREAWMDGDTNPPPGKDTTTA